MARDTGPQCKQCRREGQKLFLKGERCLTDKCGVERRSYPPGDHGRGRQKQSEYRVQLREKQKAKRYYGVLESQFRIYYGKASRQSGVTGENLLRMLECRFDNVLVRLGFAASRRQARQLILHGHWTINGRRVNIPSYQLRDSDVIAIHQKSTAGQVIRDATELTGQVPAWLQADHDALPRCRSSSSASCTPSNSIHTRARAGDRAPRAAPETRRLVSGRPTTRRR